MDLAKVSVVFLVSKGFTISSNRVVEEAVRETFSKSLRNFLEGVAAALEALSVVVEKLLRRVKTFF